MSEKHTRTILLGTNLLLAGILIELAGVVWSLGQIRTLLESVITQITNG